MFTNSLAFSGRLLPSVNDNFALSNTNANAPLPRSVLYIIPQKPLFSYGFRTGLSISETYFSGNLEFEGNLIFPIDNYLYGPSLHFFGIAKFNSLFSMQAEIGFEPKGGYFNREYSTVIPSTAGSLKFEDEFRINNNYLAFPITARASFGKVTKITFFSGYYFAYLLNSKTKTYKMYQEWEVGQTVTHINRYTYNSIDYFKKTESGLLFGCNLQIPFYQFRLGPTISLVIDGRYNVGITPIDQFGTITEDFFGKPVDNNNNMKNLNFLFSAGIVISLKEPYNRID